jgi:ribosomal protein S18 acetylase RimI-like enzyme
MGDSLSIRLAKRDDIPDMVKLLHELFAIEDDFVFNEENQSCALELLLQNSQSVVLVAEIYNDVIGMITLQRVISTAMGGYVGVIEDVVVSKAYRGVGVGTKLLSALIAKADERGWKRLALGADLRNTKAIGFYQKYGFSTSYMKLMYLYV